MEPHDTARFFKNEDIQCTNCNELIGLCKGLIADNAINQQEAEFLINWIAAHPDTAETFPGSVLAARLAGMLHDGHLDAEEAAELIALLKELTGEQRQQGSGTTTVLAYDAPMPPLVFVGQRFCLTGTFVAGKRATLSKKLAEIGAVVGNSVIKSEPCCLVVGTLVTEAWTQSSYGHKLETARAYRAEGAPVSIVSEEHLWSELLRLGYA